MTEVRFIPTVTRLPDGRFLVAGGYNDGILASAEFLDPGTRSWTATAAMTVARQYHTATVLDDARVLAAGGSNDGALASAELYDPAAIPGCRNALSGVGDRRARSGPDRRPAADLIGA